MNSSGVAPTSLALLNTRIRTILSAIARIKAIIDAIKASHTDMNTTITNNHAYLTTFIQTSNDERIEADISIDARVDSIETRLDNETLTYE